MRGIDTEGVGDHQPADVLKNEILGHFRPAFAAGNFENRKKSSVY